MALFVSVCVIVVVCKCCVYARNANANAVTQLAENSPVIPSVSLMMREAFYARNVKLNTIIKY